MIGYTYKNLLKAYRDLNVNEYTRSWRRPYRTAADWLQKVSGKGDDNVHSVKEDIRYTECELEEVKKHLARLKNRLQETCSHPLEELLHHGFACSNGTKFREIVECTVCKKRWRRCTTKIPKNFYVDI